MRKYLCVSYLLNLGIFFFFLGGVNQSLCECNTRDTVMTDIWLASCPAPSLKKKFHDQGRWEVFNRYSVILGVESSELLNLSQSLLETWCIILYRVIRRRAYIHIYRLADIGIM